MQFYISECKNKTKHQMEKEFAEKGFYYEDDGIW